MKKTALITGVNGQDGSYLAEYLLSLDYRVVGMCRRNSGLSNLAGCIDKLELCYGDLRDAMSLNTAIHKFRPDEIYNLGAQSFVPPSWVRPEDTIDVNVSGLLRILEVVEKALPDCKVYQATSSEMYGNIAGPKDEKDECAPNSPYGVAKFAAHKLCEVYRQKGLFVVSGILFNHESPRRGSEMVTRKITKHVAEWAAGQHKNPIKLGTIAAKRDWGFSGDYVKAMHALLQKSVAKDTVVGTGELHSVEDFFMEAIVQAGLDVTYTKLIETDKSLIRKTEVFATYADNSKALSWIGWKPTTSFENLVGMMVTSDIAKLRT